MKSYENLLVTAMEECDELSQAISKALRFGLDAKYNEGGVDNNHEIIKEYAHLHTMMDILFNQHILEPLQPEEFAKIKQDKLISVFKYQKLSQDSGLIDD